MIGGFFSWRRGPSVGAWLIVLGLGAGVSGPAQAYALPAMALSEVRAAAGPGAGNGSIIYIHFDKIGVLPASKLTADERREVVAAVRKKFAGTDVTLTDNADEFNELVRKNPQKTAHKLYVNSRETGSLGHAAHSGDNGKVYDSRYIGADRTPKFDDLRKDPKDPKSPLDTSKLVYGVANTAAHEIGHLLGLDDDRRKDAKLHLMKSPLLESEDMAPLDFSDADKASIAQGKFKSSTPAAKPQGRELYPVRGGCDACAPNGEMERTDWVPLSYTAPPEYRVGYVNFFGEFHPLGDIAGGVGEFALAPSVGFDLALRRRADGAMFSASGYGVTFEPSEAIAGALARFPFDGVYYRRATIGFDTDRDGAGDTVLQIAAEDACKCNGVSLRAAPYAPDFRIPEPGTLSLLCAAAIGMAGSARKWAGLHDRARRFLPEPSAAGASATSLRSAPPFERTRPRRMPDRFGR